MDIQELASFIYWLIQTKGHRTVLMDARRGRGKSQTCLALVQQIRHYGLKACFAQRPEQVRLADLLIIDDAGPYLYKRDFNKKENKAAAKALQRVRGVIPLLMLNVVDIARLDIDVRQDFGIEGQILTHGWMEISGMILGPILPESLPPSDEVARQKEFLSAFKSLKAT